MTNDELKELLDSRPIQAVRDLKKNHIMIWDKISSIWDSSIDLPVESETEKIIYYLNREKPLCTSGNKFRFISIKDGYGKYCGDISGCVSCKAKRSLVLKEVQMNPETQKKIKTTNMIRYGTDNPAKSDKIKQKIKDVTMERYGVENAFQSELFKKKSKETMMERYGVEHNQQSSEIKRKTEQTNLERYGFKTPALNQEVKEKMKETMMERYGVDTPLKNEFIKQKMIQTTTERYGTHNVNSLPEIQERTKRTNLERYGVEHYSSTEEYLEKYEKTSLERYGVSHPNKHPDVISRIQQTNIEKYGVSNHTQAHIPKQSLKLIENREYFVAFTQGKTVRQVAKELGISEVVIYRIYKKHAIDLDGIGSTQENAVFEFINSLNVDIVRNIRSIISPKEIDIWLPSYNIGFEVHGLYWHGESLNYKNKALHIDKYNMAKEKDIKLYQIFEDEINDKFDIVKSMILSKLGKIDTRYYARKTEIREIPWKEAKIFLEENHIQGQGKAGTCNIGLYQNNELVSIAVFGKLRPSLGALPVEGHYELYRFCNKLNTTTVGGFEKLFKYFSKKYNPTKIISYSDNRLFSGGIYEKSGFINDGNTSPGYWYVKNNKRIHRYNFTKKRLVEQGNNPNKTEWEIMQELGYDRIWDCGNIRWIWNK